MKKIYLIPVLMLLISWGCSTGEQKPQAFISGSFEPASDTLLTSGNAKVALTIIQEDTAGVDTLFHGSSDEQGEIAGTVRFEEKGRYPMILEYNGQLIDEVGVLLAGGDTLHVNGQLSDLGQSLSITSREHDALEMFQRVDRNFQRVMQVARRGQLQGDSLLQEMDKWSNLYWEVYEDRKGTVAANLAATESIRLLKGLNDEKMMDHIYSIQHNDSLAGLAARYGKEYLAAEQGIDPALSYLDSLSAITRDRDMVMRIDMERIKLLYDSSRVEDAKSGLEEFQKQFAEVRSAADWAENVSYDIEYLSRGDAIPDFNFTQNGQVISRDSLLGTPYLLEITMLANPLYQDQFDRTVVIHSIYKNYGLGLVTLPLDESQITVDAFFDERVKPWPVADAKTFNREDLMEKFNVQLVPTRFLIDREGNIVRKYVGNEFEDVIKEIQTLINQDKEPAS